MGTDQEETGTLSIEHDFVLDPLLSVSDQPDPHHESALKSTPDPAHHDNAGPRCRAQVCFVKRLESSPLLRRQGNIIFTCIYFL